MKRNLLLMAALLITTAVIAKNIKTAVFTTLPQMHCDNCEIKIKKNVRFVKGVKEIQTNIDRQTVTITYDADKTTPAKIIDGFKRINYTARQLKKGETVKRNADEHCTNM
ncbi:MAG: heavy-metal-associated domain-containing protein [Prevotella sp.]|nr:heavy-metal-associated domain-containing protein [Prevotella sp.]MBQ9204646.1 heavy-metal-associated domain-containing protein [Prevotella sp.]